MTLIMSIRKICSLMLFTLLAVVSGMIVAACGSADQSEENLPTTTAASGVDSTDQGTVIQPGTESGPISLTVWLPPAFAPTSGELSATILQSRLDAFHESHPNVQVEVRLKVESGEGGLIDSLEDAQQAAPLALPDLVLISSDLLPSAAESGILRPLDGLLSEVPGNDWYDFGQQMAIQNGSIYGLPFAADALILAHRPSAIEEPPETWSQVLSEPFVMGFAAADAGALFTFTQLMATPDGIIEITDRSEVDSEQLQRLLSFYAQGQANGAFPFWLTQFESREQSWQAFTEGRIPMVVAWSSRFLASSTSNFIATPLPTIDGQKFTLAKGWAWAITTPQKELETLVVELAEFLSSPDFMAQWSAAAGLLPPRSSALTAWSPDQRQALASQIVPAASILPDPEQREEIGSALSEAIVALLKQESTPAEALQFILQRLSAP